MPEDNREFEHKARLSIDDLDIEPFLETHQVQAFDCGNKALNDFLSTEEVRKYEHERVGRSYLVFHKSDLAAYFTVSQGGLRTEYLKTWKSFSRMAEMRLDAIPALTIGRLAVDVRYQKRGVGRALINFIAGMALEAQGKIAVRLIVLQAKPASVDFYKKCGFELTVETKRERRRLNRTMFLDLAALELLRSV